jgi:hypothetical protein
MREREFDYSGLELAGRHGWVVWHREKERETGYCWIASLLKPSQQLCDPQQIGLFNGKNEKFVRKKWFWRWAPTTTRGKVKVKVCFCGSKQSQRACHMVAQVNQPPKPNLTKVSDHHIWGTSPLLARASPPMLARVAASNSHPLTHTFHSPHGDSPLLFTHPLLSEFHFYLNFFFFLFF